MLPNLAVGVSGGGTNLDAILAYGLPVRLVFADRPCPAIERVRDRIATVVIERRPGGIPFNRHLHTLRTVAALRNNNIDVVALAGYMTVFDRCIFDYYGGHMLNTHPSLLPAFPGAHAVSDALAYGVKIVGCTVHLVIPEVDAGPILAQAAVPVEEGDTEVVLHERIKITAEHSLYPRTIERFMHQKFDI